VEVLPAVMFDVEAPAEGAPKPSKRGRANGQKGPHEYVPRERICRATSKQTGLPCKRIAIPGGHVCVFHGGKSPQVKHAAKERLNALVDPAITELTRLMSESDLDPVRLAVAKDILDRTGFKPKERVEVTDVNRRLESLAAGRARAQKMLESE
jgi:hypothetical protein